MGAVRKADMVHGSVPPSDNLGHAIITRQRDCSQLEGVSCRVKTHGRRGSPIPGVRPVPPGRSLRSQAPAQGPTAMATSGAMGHDERGFRFHTVWSSGSTSSGACCRRWAGR